MPTKKTAEPEVVDDAGNDTLSGNDTLLGGMDGNDTLTAGETVDLVEQVLGEEGAVLRGAVSTSDQALADEPVAEPLAEGSRDERHDSIDPHTGTLTAEAVALRADR